MKEIRWWLPLNRQLLYQILSNQEEMMASFRQLQDQLNAVEAKVADLKDVINQDQSSDAQVVAALQAHVDAAEAEVARLQALIDSGSVVTADDLATSLSVVQNISDGIQDAIADVAGPNS
jgi:hypothetical protein